MQNQTPMELNSHYDRNTKELFLGNQNLKVLPDFSNWEFKDDVKKVYLHCNRLETVDGIEELKNIETINLSSNRELKSIKPLQSLEELNVLSLCGSYWFDSNNELRQWENWNQIMEETKGIKHLYFTAGF